MAASESCSSRARVNGHHVNGSIDGDEVARIPLLIDENNVIDGARKVLEVIRPQWRSDQINFKVLLHVLPRVSCLVGCLSSWLPSLFMLS